MAVFRVINERLTLAGYESSGGGSQMDADPSRKQPFNIAAGSVGLRNAGIAETRRPLEGLAPFAIVIVRHIDDYGVLVPLAVFKFVASSLSRRNTSSRMLARSLP